MFAMQSTRKSANASHKFSQIPKADIQRSAFDRSHNHKTTFNSGWLVPIFIDESLPGDTFTLRANIFARLSTPLHPIMDNMYMETFYFAVPMRLLWDNWQKFNGEQIDPGDSTDFLIPTVNAGSGWASATLGDYFGLPLLIGNTLTSAMFFRAYNLIWNEFFRDENLQDSRPNNRGDGPDSEADFVIQRRGKRHDYFTSCLPFLQKGPAVELPLGSVAPVIPTSTGIGHIIVDATDREMRAQGAGNTLGYSGAVAGAAQDLLWATETGLETDLSAATSATINAIRQAFQIQKLYERDARGGTRYTEILLSHFGVTSPDSRLQRPEFLGGNSAQIEQAVVPQTGEAGTTPQGHLGSYGTVSSSSGGFNKSFTEHCIVMGLVSVRADLNYQQGMNRMFSRSTRWDFFWPALAHIGEQAVLNKEIYMDGTGADNNVFGYQERWAEYRYKPSLITGFLRSDAVGTLDTWHLAQDFASLPLLNATFIEDNPPIARTQAVPSEAQFIFDSHFQYTCVRPMPTYSVPGLIDHF